MIEVEHLTKQYGTHTAVSDLSFQVESGQIYGFLGPNGAGKTTTMNIMTGCLSATDGHVRIGGHDIFEEPNLAKKRIGYLPEQPPLYMNETPVEYLRFVGEAKGLRGAELKQQVEDVIVQTGIQTVKDRRISALSKGYKQRVGIAQALLGDPDVIVLDEPTVGLDPIQIIEIRALIKELGQRHTVIFSSHILSEVQNICDQILVISHGKLLAFDTPENLEKRFLSSSEITLVTEASGQEARDILSQVEHITETELSEADGLVTAHLQADSEDVRAVCRAIFFAFARAEQALLELSLKKVSLEDVFLELTEKDAAAPAAEGPTPDVEEAARTAVWDTEESEEEEGPQS